LPFSRPEVQLNLQTNVVQNNLTITIAPEEVREIEAQAAPVREKVGRMVAAYRPGALSGNGNGSGPRTVDIPPSPVEKEALPPIVRKEGDENSSAFWGLFARAQDQERGVEKATAIYVTKTIVDEAVGGGRGNQAIVSFKTEPITIGDVISVIERLCGGNPAGWQRLQRRAGVQPGPGA
jgi:hypothetical protein